MSKTSQRKMSAASNRRLYEAQKRQAFNHGLSDAKYFLPMISETYWTQNYKHFDEYLKGYKSYKKKKSLSAITKRVITSLVCAGLVFSLGVAV